MEPDIPAKSILLLDRAERSRVDVKSGRPYLCQVEDTGELALKDVHTFGDALVLESRNPKYPPRLIRLRKSQPIQEIVRAKLVWHGTEW